MGGCHREIGGHLIGASGTFVQTATSIVVVGQRIEVACPRVGAALHHLVKSHPIQIEWRFEDGHPQHRGSFDGDGHIKFRGGPSLPASGGGEVKFTE